VRDSSTVPAREAWSRKLLKLAFFASVRAAGVRLSMFSSVFRHLLPVLKGIVAVDPWGNVLTSRELNAEQEAWLCEISQQLLLPVIEPI
jgi:hypothetical protein